MYKLVAFISFLIRNFYLPNPFANLEYGAVINLIIEPILQLITFTVVGLFYQRGSLPALGSFLYLLFYAIHVGLIMLCGRFDFINTAIAIIAFCYTAAIIGFISLKYKLFTRYYL